MKTYSSTAVAIALLIVVQTASAFTIPEMVVMRLKRSPEPMRSFSFSGFSPEGQMAAFTGAAEYPMFAGYGPQSPQAAAVSPYYGQPGQDSYGPPPSGPADHQPAAADPNKQYSSAGQPEYGPKPSGAGPDSKEQIGNSVEQTDGKKQYRGRDGPSSNAEASFNAWFPIMFGVFPNGAGGGIGGGQSGSNSANRGGDNSNQGQGHDQGYQSGGNGFERSSGGTTVIANSVSNGRHGVATSHAIAYGNPRSSPK